jgi:hypothetical protein
LRSSRPASTRNSVLQEAVPSKSVLNSIEAKIAFTEPLYKSQPTLCAQELKDEAEGAFSVDIGSADGLLSDPGVEDAPYESYAPQSFAGDDLQPH